MARQTKVPTKKIKAAVRSEPQVVKGGRQASRPEIRPVRKPAKMILTQSERKNLIAKLVSLREELTGQVAALKNDSLKRNDEVNPVEDGTDAYDRQFALSLASSEQEAVAQINDALRRITEGTYGVCEQCQGAIEKARVEALPFVRTCIRCQSELERHNSKFRPSSGPADAEQWEENRSTTSEGEEEEA